MAKAELDALPSEVADQARFILQAQALIDPEKSGWQRQQVFHLFCGTALLSQCVPCHFSEMLVNLCNQLEECQLDICAFCMSGFSLTLGSKQHDNMRCVCMTAPLICRGCLVEKESFGAAAVRKL